MESRNRPDSLNAQLTHSQGQVWMQVARLTLAIIAGLVVTRLNAPQYITGPIVNAILILSVLNIGTSGAILVGIVTPLSAALSGVLPLPLAIMIPFIAIGNATLALVFGALEQKSRWLALVVAATAKFAFLYLAVTLLVARPLSVVIGGAPQTLQLPGAMVQMMSWPQLGTALLGGVLALGVNEAGKAIKSR